MAVQKETPKKRNEPPVKEATPGQFNLSFDMPRTEYIVCEICGHKNPLSAGLCEMCSGYLFTK